MHHDDRDRGVFVPAVMGAGLLFSIAVLLVDSVEHVMGGRGRVVSASAAREVARQTLGHMPADPNATDVRRRRVFTILAMICFGVALYVAPGAFFNYVRPGGYLAEAAWVLALGLGLAIIAGLLGVVFGLAAARPRAHYAPAQRAWWAAEALASRASPTGTATHRSWGRTWHGTASVVILGCAMASAVWTLVVAMNARLVQEWDDRLLDTLRSWDGPWVWFEPMGRTELGVAVAVVASVVVSRRTPRLGVAHVVAVSLGVLANVVMKAVIDRGRPSAPAAATGLASYPSGHMIQASIVVIFVTAAVWTLTSRRTVSVIAACVLAAAALACGLSRVTEAAHWPSDVVGGALVGTTIAVVGLVVAQAHHVQAGGRVPLLLLSPGVTAGARRWARRLVVTDVIALALLIATVGVPADPQATLNIVRLEQSIQLGLLVLISVGLAASWWWDAASAVLLAVAGTAMAWFAALQYEPMWAMVIAVVFLIPAFMMWLAWQHGQTTRSLGVMAVTAATLLSATWAGASAVHDRYFGPTHPASGLVAVDESPVQWIWTGDVASDRFTVVASLHRAHPDVEIVVATTSSWADARVVMAPPRREDGRVIAATVEALEPGMHYVVAVRVAGVVDELRTARVRTPLDGPHSFRVAFGACARTGSNGSVFDAIRTLDPELYLITGDAHYGDVATDDEDRLRAVWDTTLSTPAQQALYQRVPVAYVWDDHDFGGNDADASSPARDMAHRVYREIVPHATLERPDDIGQSFVMGRVRFVLTDTRSQRVPAVDGAGVMLGPRQERWFMEELRTARDSGQVVVWVSPTPWIAAADPTSDTWAGFAQERRRLADFMVREGIDDVVMVSGDAHMVAIDDGTNSGYATQGGSGFVVAHGGALDRRGSVKGGPYSEGAFPGGGQFGVLDITDLGGPVIRITVTGRTWRGDELVRYSVEFQVGTPTGHSG